MLPGLLTPVDMPTQVVQGLHNQHQLVIQFARFSSNLLSIAVLVFITPDIVNRSQCCQQSGGAHQNNALVIGIPEKRMVMLQRQHKGRLHRHKNQHKVQTIHAFELLVRFATQSINVGAYGKNMLFQGALFLVGQFCPAIAFVVR